MRQTSKAIPPGEHLRDEIEERGWTQSDLARILGRPVKVVNEILNGKRAITIETAKELSRALGTSAELWINLESAYRLATSTSVCGDDPIARRAKLFDKAPVSEMIRRGWIKDSQDVGGMERELQRFFGLDSVDTPVSAPRTAARTGLVPTTDFNSSQTAWLHRVVQLSRGVSVQPFDIGRFRQGMGLLRTLAGFTDQVRQVPRALADLGIAIVIVEHLKGTRIDGACVWLREDKPVIALSLRFDRIDWFWHTLMHEVMHVENEDHLSLDEAVEDGFSATTPAFEKRADEAAANYLIPTHEMENFILRAGPLYSREKIVGFASRVGVHPGIVVGQLHHRGELEYSFHRKLLEKVRPIAVRSTLTDGWGNTVEID